jgi:hypothetical protein
MTRIVQSWKRVRFRRASKRAEKALRRAVPHLERVAREGNRRLGRGGILFDIQTGIAMYMDSISWVAAAELQMQDMFSERGNPGSPAAFAELYRPEEEIPVIVRDGKTGYFAVAMVRFGGTR